MNIDYNGRPDFSRPRKLYEVENIEQYEDKQQSNAFNAVDERVEATDVLFTDLAKVYLKGQVLKEALSKMEPAQFIPIEESADPVRAAAIRLAKQESKEGTIITYSLFQKCVDLLLNKKWELRGTIVSGNIPGTVYERTTETSRKVSGSKLGSMLEEFISQNGVITTIIGMLTLSPFQTVIFQALGVEQAAKGVQVSQIPLGLVIFLELGIKAERIIKMMKEAKISTPVAEQALLELEKSPEKRAEAFGSIGIDYNEYLKSQENQDSEVIVKYVNEYYARYGGLVSQNSHLTLDHWVAYAQVAQNQQLLRGAVNSSSTFSPKFRSFQNQYDPPLNDSQTQTSNVFGGGSSNFNLNAAILNELASSIRAAESSSDQIYDDIVNSLSYQLDDRSLCCLVQIFGAIANPDILTAVAYILRILASGFGSELSRAFNTVLRFLMNLIMDALFELISKLNEFYTKIVVKIAKAFTIEFDNLPACNIMLTLGWSIIQSIKALFDMIYALIRDLMNFIGGWGFWADFKWELTADRRTLLGIARILEVLAAKISLANTCARPDQKNVNIVEDFDDRQARVDEAIFTILGAKDPVLEIKTEDLAKYFPNLQPKVSKNLKYSYGIRSQQNNETAAQPKCEDRDQQDKLNELIKNITSALEQSFNG